jgi:hypothetical protein
MPVFGVKHRGVWVGGASVVIAANRQDARDVLVAHPRASLTGWPGWAEGRHGSYRRCWPCR